MTRPLPPMVGLLTDFGTHDGTVGALKGSVLASCPDARLIDVSHHVPPQDVVAGSFLLARAVVDLPPSTVHLAVVDPGVGTLRRALALRNAAGIWIVGPDNGLLGEAATETGLCIELDPDRVVPGKAPSPTFHGRDVFGPAAGRLAAGDDPTNLGDVTTDGPQRLPRPLRARDGVIEADVVWVDRFGNVITAIQRDDVVGMGDDLEIAVDDVIVRGISRTYGDVERRQNVAYWGSHDTLEVGQRDAHFADRQGVGRGSRVRVRRAGS